MASRRQADQPDRKEPASFDFESTLQLAVTLQGRGELEEAERRYLACLAARPSSFEVLYLIAVLRIRQGRLVEALECLGSAMARNSQSPQDFPRLIPGLKFLSNEFGKLQRPEDAAASFELLRAIEPNNIAFINAHCRTLQSLGRLPETMAATDMALALDPNSAITHLTRGNSLHLLHRFEEAIAHYEKALEIDPRLVTAYKNIAGALNVLGHEEAALGHLDEALKLAPDDAQARASKGIFSLGLGRFAVGWEAYEGRFGQNASAIFRRYPQPRWDGGFVDGTLAIWGEQGLGDQILYASMVPDLVERARHIVLEVETRLVGLFARSFPGVQVVPQAREPYGGLIAAQEPLGGLGRHLRLDWSAFPNRPQGYLTADFQRSAALRSRLADDGRRIIGLSWKTQNAQHVATASVGLDAFAELLRLPNCRFVDLQYGDTQAERDEIERTLGVRIEHLNDIDNRNDIDGLAALIAACDAVVTTGNITAHLAGALGVPTWTFVPHGHGRSWYWFRDHDDSPWYPRLRVKSQAEGEAWADLIAAAVSEEIEVAMRGPAG